MDEVRRGEISRREFMLLTAGFSAAAILAACSSSSPTASGGAPASGSTGGGKGRKSIPFFTTENAPASLAFYASVIASFQQKYPDVDVPITIYQDSNQLQYLTTAFQTGTDVGLFSPPPSSIAGWAAAGYLLPLDDVISGIGTGDFLDGTRVVVGGHDYAIPFQANSSAVYYRKDLLQKAGIQQPQTYNDYLNAIKALNGQNGIVGIACAIGPTPEEPLQFFTPYIHQSGWDYFAPDGTLRFGENDVLDAVKRFVAVMQNTTQSFYNAGYGDILTAYIAGRAAFATFPGRLGVNLDAQAPNLADVTGVMGIPAGDFMTAQLHFGGTQHYTIYSKTANVPETKAFLQMLASGDNALAWSLTVPGHLLPALKSVQDKLRTADNPYVKKHNDWINTFLDLVPGAMHPGLAMGSVDNHTFTKKLSNPCPWGNQVWTSPPVDGTMLQQILINKQDPEQAWTAAKSKMGSIASTWKSQNPNWKPAS